MTRQENDWNVGQHIHALLEFFERYYAGTATLDGNDYSQWFALPLVVDASSLPGAAQSREPLLFTTRDEIREWRRDMGLAYRKLGFSHHVAQVCNLWVLSDRSAIVIGHVRRLREDGSAINASSHLYVVVRREGQWRISSILPAAELP